MAADKVTSEEIAQLTHSGMIDFAARCPRIALDLAYPPDSPDKFPGPSEDRLRIAEHWASDDWEWQRAAEFAPSIRAGRTDRTDRPADERKAQVWDRANEVLSHRPSFTHSWIDSAIADAIKADLLPAGSGAERTRVAESIADAIEAALRTALSKHGAPGQDHEAAGHTQEAYKRAREAFLRSETPFDHKAREYFDTLPKIDAAAVPSGAAPEQAK